MPGSSTTPGCRSARDVAFRHVAFRRVNNVGARDNLAFAAQWLACAIPCRRFATGLAASDARLGADVDRYSFMQRTLTAYSLLVSRRTGNSNSNVCTAAPLPAAEGWRHPR